MFKFFAACRKAMNSVKNLSDKVEDKLTEVALEYFSEGLTSVVAAKQVVDESRLPIQLYCM